MLTTPYSIYVNKRPLRVAFFIEDKPESLPIIDNVIRHNCERWGGRYNPLVITDGQTLTDTWWVLLEAMDPDVVMSFVTLSDNLIESIDRRISPYFIQQPESREKQDGNRSIHLLDKGLSILPTPLNIRIANWTIGESNLVLFETDSDTDPLIKRFTELNFGGYSHPVHAISRTLEDVRTQVYSVTDFTSLSAALSELSTFRAFTYPIQLCSIPKEALPPVKYDRSSETFHVIIGDSPADVAYFWNRPASIPQDYRTFLNQVWIPLGLATNPQLSIALSSWLQRSADPNGNGGAIRFVSLSLSQEKLQEVVESLTCNLLVSRNVNALREIQPPKVDEGFSEPPVQKKMMDLYRATGTTERLTLKEPDVLTGPRSDEYWMADLYIEFRPEHYPTIEGRTLWWQIPRLNGLALQMFQRSSRILKTRYPSVLMKQGEPRLDITLLDDISIFSTLAALPSEMMYCRLDARHGKMSSGRSPYHQAQRSDKGRYLSGLLDLFGGLHPATSSLEERYWRSMFDLLSGRTAHKNSEQLQVVGNKLRKRLGKNPAQFYKDKKDMEWLANYVLQLARSLPASSRDLEFHIFDNHAKQEMDDFNTGRKNHEPWPYSQVDLKYALAYLTERGVLLIGVKAKCPSCGYRAWWHINDAKQTLQCRGCKTMFPMPPEQRWSYRLNSLAQAAIAEHGLLPVVLILGQLLMDAKSAFLFAPCLDVFEKGEKRPAGDLDIAVIRDGQFVIGEVKLSRKLFDKATFVKMEDIARRLLPDILLFASMDRKPTKFITKEIKRLSEELQPLNIKVQWYPLHEYKFDASPVR